VIHPPSGMGSFQFVVLAKLRVVQLTRGCRPRVDGEHKSTVTAQHEIAQGKVTQLAIVPGSREAAIAARVQGGSSIVVQPA
jgi:hypothetical protein